jgi:hypothetical protein
VSGRTGQSVARERESNRARRAGAPEACHIDFDVRGLRNLCLCRYQRVCVYVYVCVCVCVRARLRVLAGSDATPKRGPQARLSSGRLYSSSSRRSQRSGEKIDFREYGSIHCERTMMRGQHVDIDTFMLIMHCSRLGHCVCTR